MTWQEGIEIFLSMKRRELIQLVVFALSAIVYFPFSEWLSTTQGGTSLFLWGQMIYVLPLVASILAMPFLVFGLFFRDTRRRSCLYLLCIALFVPCCIFGVGLGDKARMAGMKSFAQRSQTLIRAIENYERDHSGPPQSLNDLVPDYIPAVPCTGMAAYPEYRYHTGDMAKQQYAGNSWVLTVFTPSGFLNFDMMLYFPNQNYPHHGYGGSLEPVGDWAYVHE